MGTIFIYAQAEYFSANGQIYFEVDDLNYKIKNIFNGMTNKTDMLDEVELGFYINKNYYPLHKIATGIKYIENTGIIEITAKKNDINIKCSIYAPFDANKDSIFVVTDVSTEKLDKKVKVNFVYKLYSKKYGNIYWNKWRKYYCFGELYIKPLLNYNSLKVGGKKFETKNNKIRKKKTDHIEFLSYVGELENYDEKREIFMISFSSIDKEFVNNLPSHYILNQEINSWVYWQDEGKNIEFEKNEKIVKQNLALLKMLQLENGLVVSEIKKNKINTYVDDMLYSAYAFVNAGHLKEAEKIFEYILNYDKELSIFQHNDNVAIVQKSNQDSKNDLNAGLFLIGVLRLRIGMLICYMKNL